MSPHEQLRARIGSARRVVVKTGSSSLTTSAGQIDATRVNGLVDVVAEQVDVYKRQPMDCSVRLSQQWTRSW